MKTMKTIDRFAPLVRTPKPGSPIVFIVLIVLIVSPLGAQALRSFTAARPLGGESRLDLVLQLHDGAYRIMPADSGRLYDLNLEYDPARLTPSTRRQADSLELSLRSDAGRGFQLRPPRRLFQGGEVTLSPEVEWSIRLLLGGAEATTDLGGLRLTELDVDAAASRTTVRVPEPNPALCRRATFRVGAGELTLDALGNLGCREVLVDADFGRVTLDLSGALPGDLRADVKLAVGTLRIRAPQDAGLRVTTERFLSLLDLNGLIREGDAWVSPGYGEARRKIDLRLETSLARVVVEWIPGPER